MTAQAFCYNAIFFTYALVLGRYFAVPPQDVGLYLLPFALGNFLGPLVLGRYFDTWGRRPMIASTYACPDILLAATAALFVAGVLTAATQTLAWTVVFFFASAAASSAYLTVSEMLSARGARAGNRPVLRARHSARRRRSRRGCSARSSAPAIRRRSPRATRSVRP